MRTPSTELPAPWPLPPDLEPAERDVAGWMHALAPVAASDLLRARVRTEADVEAAPGGRFAWAGVAAAVLVLGLGLAGFSRAAEKAAHAGCAGARCAEPIVAVVDDPTVPLYRSLEALAAADGAGGCWEALAELGDHR